MEERTPKWENSNISVIKRNAVIFAAIFIAFGALLWGYSAWVNMRRVPQLPGEVILKYNKNLQTAADKIQEAGYTPISEPEKEGWYERLFYASSELLGYETIKSELGVSSSNVHFVHYFQDEDKKNSGYNQGNVFKALTEKLTGIIGQGPREIKSKSSRTRWLWDLRGKTELNLYYVGEGVIAVEYAYKN
ncbi:MAG: hypothetical protein IKZ98_08745 [Clostridia bacterium]|nr:hypothetical protein [Clostridia bacterium]